MDSAGMYNRAMQNRAIATAWVMGAGLLAAASLASAQTVRATPFSAQQSAAGRALYPQQCAACHGAALEGTEAGPALRGQAFMSKWANKSFSELFEATRRTMPVTQPGRLSREQYAGLLAHVMESNGLVASAIALDVDPSKIPPDTEWLHHRGDAGSLNYSPLEQIDRGNVSRLRVAWRWRSDNFGASIYPQPLNQS